ncbi:hypothetical protein VTG60DRAFT_2725 [Thermothelomyces hinnuleus]
MSKPANSPTISAPTTSAKANENDTKNKDCNRTPPSSPRYTYKPAIPWAYASLPPSQLTTYLDVKKKPPKKPHLAVRIVQSHFLLKLPAILAITLALACLPAAIRDGYGNDGNAAKTAAAAAPTAFLRNLLHGVWVAFAFQAAVAAPSALLRTELLFDLSGAACFVTVVAGALGSRASANRAGASAGAGDWAAAAVEGARAIGRAVESWDGRVWEEIGVDWRQGWVSALVCIWAVRRGIFTFVRALCRNGDSRFDRFRANRKKFFAAFMMQSVWVTFCAIPVIALNSIPAQGFIGTSWQTSGPISALTSSGRMLWFWLGVWAFFRGLMIECVADWQLTKWRLDKYRKRHDEVFCRRGFWERSRHPNYYGEWLLWFGISMCCSAVLLSSAARNTTGLGLGTALVLCAITPYFVYKTLRNISIPLIEEKYDKMYMVRKDYRDWRRNRTFRLWLDGSGIIWGYF